MFAIFIKTLKIAIKKVGGYVFTVQRNEVTLIREKNLSLKVTDDPI